MHYCSVTAVSYCALGIDEHTPVEASARPFP